MRRISLILLSILLLAALAVPVWGANAASGTGIHATVAVDGSCQISMTVTLHLDAPVENLTFPVPAEATAIALNGSRVITRKMGEYKLINLSRIAGKVAGDTAFTVTYSLANVVSTNEAGITELRLPMLSGFAYPVDKMDFTVTLPGGVSTKPSFTSGYHQTNIEKFISYEMNGAVITGTSLSSMKDHEILHMTLVVPEEMFLKPVLYIPSYNALHVAMWVLAGVALLYWLFSLRCKPVLPERISTAPAGYTAGELGSILTLQGGDLTMMIFSWAQLGYILITGERGGSVRLHKRMEMGNERSAYERKCFHNLFGNRSTVDTANLSYATLQQKTAAMKPNLLAFIHPRSGNPLLFRGLTAGIGLCCGLCLGIGLGGETVKILYVLLGGAYGLVAGWQLQNFTSRLFLRQRPQALTIVLGAGFLLLGLLSGQFGIGMLACFTQLTAGMMAAYGGRRTDAGRQALAQVLGLRLYLRKLSRDEAMWIFEQTPDYFHHMMPWAIALGVSDKFAAAFDDFQLPACPYLTTGMDGHMTAPEWNRVMLRMVNTMDNRLRQLPKERLLGLLRGLFNK